MKAPLSYVPALQPLMGWIAGILIWWSGGEAVWACVAAAIGLFVLFYPVLSGQPVSMDYVQNGLRWLAGWVLVL